MALGVGREATASRRLRRHSARAAASCVRLQKDRRKSHPKAVSRCRLPPHSKGKRRLRDYRSRAISAESLEERAEVPAESQEASAGEARVAAKELFRVQALEERAASPVSQAECPELQAQA